MNAFNQMGWLCGERQIPRQVPDQPRVEQLMSPPTLVLDESAPWWVHGDAPFIQFDHFLDYLLGGSNAVKIQLEALLQDTPLSGAVAGVIADARSSF
jgi:hypothetical protein